MAVPTVVGVGPANSGTTAAVTYALPAHQADDILLLFVEVGATVGATAPSGWSHVANSPRAQGSNVSTGNLMWKRATSSSETNPTVPGQANHQVGFTAVIRGCVTTGSPFDTATGVNSNLGPSLSVVMGSTSADDSLVVLAASSSADAAADQFGAFTNSSLSSITKQGSAGTTNGNGGSVDMVTGAKAAAGSAGTWTATQSTSTQWVGIGVSLLAAPAVTGPQETWWTGSAEVPVTELAWWTGSAEVPVTSIDWYPGT